MQSSEPLGVSRSTRWTILYLALLCAAPLIWQWHHFQQFYWLYDDWDMTSEWDDAGLAKWIWQPFAGESWFPLFKLLWAAAIRTTGSYFGLILLLWTTHLAIVALLGGILARCGFPLAAAGVAMITLGLPWSNLETLTWAMQWCHLLAILFLLLAWHQVLSIVERRQPEIWRYGLAFLFAAASALSFSLGVLTGPLLALFLCLLPRKPSEFRSRLVFGLALVLIAPALALAHGHLSVSQDVTWEKLGGALQYGVWYELFNPLYYLVSIPRKTVDMRALAIMASLKIAVIAVGLRAASASQRRILWTLLVFDLAMAALLGVRRQQHGLGSTVSSRYQYVSLLCFGPFLGLALAWARDRVPLRRPAREMAFAACVIAWGLNLGYPWGRHAERWAIGRGVELRRALEAAPDDQRFGLAGITAGRARELIRRYNLR